MQFEPLTYGTRVAEILALDGNGCRLMPLAEGTCSNDQARTLLKDVSAKDLFPDSRAPEAALSGLWLYFSCLDESHALSQGIHTVEGSFWHAIKHRQEPDSVNATFWFRKVGRHAIFPKLAEFASELKDEAPGVTISLSSNWDPFQFIRFVDKTRQKPGSDDERVAMLIQRVEWQLLFDYCASPS